MSGEFDNEVVIPVGDLALEGELTVPVPYATEGTEGTEDSSSRGVILFAHGSGSSRLSARNLVMAHAFQEAGFATLLFNLLTREEEVIDAFTRHLRFDIPLLAERLVAATRWVRKVDRLQGAKLGYFGSSTGAGAALIAAATVGEPVSAIVSRSGRPDLASRWLRRVHTPSLFIVGELDFTISDLTRKAIEEMECPVEMVAIPGATHLFDEPGALEQAATEATRWFRKAFASGQPVVHV